jgi:hypothetical protein
VKDATIIPGGDKPMTASLMEAPTMAPGKLTTQSVKLETDVLEAARIVSAYRGVSMTELLGEVLRPALAKMEQEEIAKRQKAARKPKGGAE